MNFAIATFKNLFKKSEFKSEVKKLLGPDINFEKVLTELFEVLSQEGFFENNEWQNVIVKSIESVISPAHLHLDERQGIDADNNTTGEVLHINDSDTAAVRASLSPVRMSRVKSQSHVLRRSTRVQSQTELFIMTTKSEQRAVRRSNRLKTQQQK